MKHFPGFIRAEKSFENTTDFIFWESNTGVLNFNFAIDIFCFKPDNNLTFRRIVLKCIAQQIGDAATE